MYLSLWYLLQPGRTYIVLLRNLHLRLMPDSVVGKLVCSDSISEDKKVKLSDICIFGKSMCITFELLDKNTCCCSVAHTCHRVWTFLNRVYLNI